MRKRCDTLLAQFASGRSSFKRVVSDLSDLRAQMLPGSEDSVAEALQRAINGNLLPYGLACALLQGIDAENGVDGALPPSERVHAAEIERLLVRFRPLGRHPVPSPDSKTSLIGQILRNRFFLDAEVGHGGMGVVYRAIDQRRQEVGALSPYVAIKLLNPALVGDRAAIRSLEAEARNTQTLGHPSIVAVHDFDRDGDRVFMVMEYLVGYPLDVMLRRHKDFAGSTLARSALQDLLSGLDFAHRRGVIHADLKPSNLFICINGQLKILDFGIAALLARADADLAMARAVTPVYASPERLSGQPRSLRDDVYALGCLIHLLLVGQHPYDRLNATEAMWHGRAPPRLEGLSEYANAVVARSLAFDAARRPTDASEIWRVLRD